MEHAQIPHAQHLGQPPAHPPGGAVQVGVARIERNAAADSPFDAALHLVCRIEALERMENDRMVRDDHVAPFAFGLGHHFVRDVHGQQRPVHLVVRAPHDQACVVVRFLPCERCETLDDIGHFPD